MSMGLKLSTGQGQGQVTKSYLSSKVRAAHVIWPIWDVELDDIGHLTIWPGWRVKVRSKKVKFWNAQYKTKDTCFWTGFVPQIQWCHLFFRVWSRTATKWNWKCDVINLYTYLEHLGVKNQDIDLKFKIYIDQMYLSYIYYVCWKNRKCWILRSNLQKISFFEFLGVKKQKCQQYEIAIGKQLLFHSFYCFLFAVRVKIRCVREVQTFVDLWPNMGWHDVTKTSFSPTMSGSISLKFSEDHVKLMPWKVWKVSRR